MILFIKAHSTGGETLVNPDFPDILYIECPREMIISIGNCNFTLRFRTNRDAGFHPAAFFPLAVVFLAFTVEIARSSSLLWLSWYVSSLFEVQSCDKILRLSLVATVYVQSLTLAAIDS